MLELGLHFDDCTYTDDEFDFNARIIYFQLLSPSLLLFLPTSDQFFFARLFRLNLSAYLFHSLTRPTYFLTARFPILI